MTRLLKSDLHFGDSGLHAADEKVVGVPQAARPRILRLELLDDIVSRPDGPIEAEAIHRAEDVVIVVEADHSQLLIAIHTELLLSCEDVKSVNLAHLRGALKYRSTVYNKIIDTILVEFI